MLRFGRVDDGTMASKPGTESRNIDTRWVQKG